MAFSAAGTSPTTCTGHPTSRSAAIVASTAAPPDMSRFIDSFSQDTQHRGGVPEEEIEDAWHRVQLVADTVTAAELAGLDDRDLLRRLFAEDDVRMFRSAPVYFRCRCSRSRVATMLRALGREEVDSVLEEFGQVEVRCEFCSRAYRFDAVDAAALFAPGGDTHAGGVH